MKLWESLDSLPFPGSQFSPKLGDFERLLDLRD